MNLYVSYYSYDFLTEVNLNTLARIQRLDLGAGLGDSVVDCIEYDRNIYLGRYSVAALSAEIIRVDPSTMIETGRLVLPEPYIGGGNNKYLVALNDILYVACEDPAPGVNGGVVRVNLSAFTRIDRLDLAVRRPQITLDSDNGLIYISYWLSTQVDRLDPATFTITGSINMANNFNQVKLVHDGKIYLGHGNAGADRLTRIDIPTFVEDATILLAGGEAWIWGMAVQDPYLYLGLASAAGQPGRVVRIHIPTFTRVDVLTFPLDPGGWPQSERDCWSLFIHDNYLWVLCESLPTNIVKVDINTFTRVDGLRLLADEGDSWSGALFTPVPAFRINKAYALAREEL